MKDYDQIDPKQYDARHDKSNREGYLKDHWRPLIASMIVKYCANKTVLDLGCGTGTYTALIAQNTINVIGLDVSKVMLGYARTKLNNVFILADACHIPLGDETIGALVSIGLFEYIDRAAVLQEIRRVLKPGSVCIIQCPNRFSNIRMVGKIVGKILHKDYPAKEPSYGEMVGLFKSNSFDIVEAIMNDGLVWIPEFLDRLAGRRIYQLIERIFGLLGGNPFSNGMLFIVRKK